MRRLLVLLVLVLYPNTLLAEKPKAKPEAADAGAPDAELAIPQGSSDYSRALALAVSFKRKAITEAEFTKRVVALKLPPHAQGDLYVTAPVPMPPPGVPFDPGLMPSDWVGTWGEVAMTFWRGAIDQAQYDAVHKAAHGKRPGFPNCKP